MHCYYTKELVFSVTALYSKRETGITTSAEKFGASWAIYLRKTKNTIGHYEVIKAIGRIAKVVQMFLFILSDIEEGISIALI